MDHLFENLRAEFAKYGILPTNPLSFGLDPEFIYLLFNTCTKIIDGKPLNVRNTDNIQIDPTSDDYKNKIMIPSQNGLPIPDFIQDKDVNPYYLEGVPYDYSKLTNNTYPIYFENKETLVNACKLFLFLYRKKTCTKYMKKSGPLDKKKYDTLNTNAPQEISFIEEWTKKNSSGGQVSKDAYNEMLGRLKCRNNFRSDSTKECSNESVLFAGGAAGISAKDALDNVLISLNINIPSDPPDNQTYRLCKISGMPPLIGSPDMMKAAMNAKLTASLGEDANITDADRAIKAKADDDAAARNAAAIAEGEKFTNIQPKIVEGMEGGAASSNQIENLFTGIINDVKLFFGYAIVMILVIFLCYTLMSASPTAFTFLSDAFVFVFKNVGDIATMLFTGLGLSLTGAVDMLSGVAVGLTAIVSMIVNICFAVFKDFAFAVYGIISIALSSMSTILFAGINYVTQQVLNFADMTFGTSGWLGASGFNYVYAQTLTFIGFTSIVIEKALVYLKDQIFNFYQASSGSGITILDMLYKLSFLFFTIVYTFTTTLITLLLSSIAFILNFFLGTTTNIVQTLYNYSSDQIDLFVKLVFGSGSSMFKIVYELIILIGKLIFASLYTFVEVLLSIISALMKLILGSSGSIMNMIMNFFSLIITLLQNIGSGVLTIIYDIFAFLGTTLGNLPGMSFSYIANLFSSVFNKVSSVPNPSE